MAVKINGRTSYLADPGLHTFHGPLPPPPSSFSPSPSATLLFPLLPLNTASLGGAPPPSPSRNRIWCIFSLKIWHLAVPILLIFRRINWPQCVHFSNCFFGFCHWLTVNELWTNMITNLNFDSVTKKTNIVIVRWFFEGSIFCIKKSGPDICGA